MTHNLSHFQMVHSFELALLKASLQSAGLTQSTYNLD